MKQYILIQGPHGSGKTKKARQVNPTVPKGNTIEVDTCLEEIKSLAAIGYNKSIQFLIMRNVPNIDTLQHLVDLAENEISDKAGNVVIVFTSANINPLSIPVSLTQKIEMISLSYPEEKLLIHFDDECYNGEISNLESLASYGNEAIRLFNSLSVGEFNREEFQQLIFNTKKLVAEKQIENGEVVVRNLKLNKKKLMDLVELPDTFPELEKMATHIQMRIQRIMVSRRLAEPRDVLNLYFFDDEGVYRLKERLYAKVRESNEVYVRSADAKKAYFFAKEYLALLKKYNVVPYNAQKLTEAHIKIDKNGKYIVNWQGIHGREFNNFGFLSFN